MAEDGVLEAVIKADASGFNRTIEGVLKQLGGLRSAIQGVAGVGFLGKAVHEAIQGEASLAKLKAVYTSMNPVIAQATGQAGHWATVTRQSGEHVKEWTSALKAAQGQMERLSAKQAAGIPLTQAEHNAYAKAAAAAQQYGNALAGATSSQKTWVSGMSQALQGTGVAFDTLIKQANDLSRVTVFSDEQIMDAQRVMLTFKNITGDLFPKTIELATNLATTFDQDLGSSIVQLGKALDDPVQGLTALKRIGVSFDAQQTKMIQNFVKTNQLGKAQAMMFDIIAQQAGDSAKAVGQTLGGAFAILGNRVSNFMEGVGGALSPMLKGLAGIAGTVVDYLEPFAPVLAGVAVAMTAVQIAGLPVVGMLASFLAPIGALAAGMVLLRQAWDTDFAGIRTSVTGFVASIQPELNKLRDLFGNFMSILTTGESPIAAVAEFDRAGNAIQQQAAMVREGWETFASDKIKKKPMAFGDRLSKAVEETWPAIKTALDSLGTKIGNWLETDVFPKVGKRIINTLAPSLMSAFSIGIGGLDIGKIFDEATKKGTGQQSAPAGPDTAKAFLSPITKSIETHGSGIFLDALNPALSTALNGLNVEGWAKGDGSKMFGTAFGLLADVAGKELGTIAGAITSAVAKGLQDILRAIGGNLSFIPGMGAVSAAIEATIKKLDGKATGGPVTGGRSYMVGESGPELFVPSTSGTIVPNGSLGGSSGGGTYHIATVNVYGVSNPDEMYAQIQQVAHRRNRPLASAM